MRCVRGVAVEHAIHSVRHVQRCISAVQDFLGLMQACCTLEGDSAATTCGVPEGLLHGA
jgi:hypothetical protein